MLIRCCPRCFSLKVHRSRPKSLLETLILPLCLLRPYRCEKCHHRYYGSLFSRKFPLQPDEARESPGHFAETPLGALRDP